LLTDLRTRQIHIKNGPMAQRLYEPLHSLEVELKESGKIYKCLPGKHDDLAISLGVLNWAIRHSHWPSWA